MKRGLRIWVGLCCVAALALPLSAEERKTGWFDTAELSLVSTSGNSESTTVGFKNVLTRVWDKAQYKLEVGGIHAESRPTGGRFAVGAPGNFSVIEPEKTTDTERYFIKNSFDRNISPRTFWRAGLDADRNRPSGIEHTVIGTGSIGNVWLADKEGVNLKTTYGVSYTDEEFTDGLSDSFAGIRLSYEYDNQLTESTKFESSLVVDESLDESDDYRADFYNAVSVAISKTVALKAGLRLNYRNLPPFETLDLFDVPGGMLLGTVPVEKDDLDSVFSTSLVMTF